MQSDAAFKPCPFCGNAARFLPLLPGFYTERVICDTCGFHLKPEQWQERAGRAIQSGPLEDCHGSLVGFDLSRSLDERRGQR